MSWLYFEQPKCMKHWPSGRVICRHYIQERGGFGAPGEDGYQTFAFLVAPVEGERQRGLLDRQNNWYLDHVCLPYRRAMRYIADGIEVTTGPNQLTDEILADAGITVHRDLLGQMYQAEEA